MGKKSGITFPALQGLVGLMALLTGLLHIFRPGMLGAWSFAFIVAGVCINLGVAALIRKYVLSKNERDEMDKKHRVEARDERNVRLREKSAYIAQGIILVVLGAATLAAALMLPYSPTVFAVALGILCLHCFLPLAIRLMLGRFA